MGQLELTRLIITITALLILLVVLFSRTVKFKNPFNAAFISKTAIFAALATILYAVPYLKFPLIFFPGFLEIHFDEVPALIAGFAYGPLSGTLVLVIKTLIKLPMTTTLGVGELADLIYGFILVFISSMIYRRKHSIKGAVKGIVIASLVQVVISSFFTTFVMLHFYMNVMGLTEEVILNMCKLANPNVTNINWSFLLWVALPFNLIKDIIIGLITFLLYKRLHRFIDKLNYSLIK